MVRSRKSVRLDNTSGPKIEGARLESFGIVRTCTILPEHETRLLVNWRSPRSKCLDCAQVVSSGGAQACSLGVDQNAIARRDTRAASGEARAHHANPAGAIVVIAQKFVSALLGVEAAKTGAVVGVIGAAFFDAGVDLGDRKALAASGDGFLAELK